MTVVLDEVRAGHAVLMVRTDRGDFILDNQSRAVLAWSDTGYEFIKREGADGRSWVALSQGKRMKVCNPIAEAFRGGHRCGNPVEPSNRRGLMAEGRPILGIDRLHAFALQFGPACPCPGTMFGLTYRSSGQPHGLHSRETGSVTCLPWFAADLLKDKRPERGGDRPSHRGRALNPVWMLPCWAE